ncbi:carbohydrate porin [Brevundimonas sp.]|uniref:carbohydrate porin n=1 Tax=Brevundimonas sp. TaxID=1871086 RepID=UPI003F71682C
MAFNHPVRRIAGVALFTVIGAAPALAQTSAQTPAPSAFAGTLTGDWGGLRDRLKDRGVTLTAGEITETAWNAIGDTPQFVRTSGQLSLGATIDADRMFGIEGGKFQVTISNRHGKALTNDSPLGIIQQVQPVYGRGQVWRLSQFWYEQSFPGGSIKLGRMSSAEDFAGSACDFQNLTLCGSAPGHIAHDVLYNFPVSQWGARVKLNVAPQHTVSVGVYESNPENLRPSQGFNFGFDVDDGFLTMVETAWTPSFGQGLGGSYKVGGWYDTADVPDVVTDVNGDWRALTGLPGQERSGRYGFYANALQTLRAPESDGSGAIKVYANAIVTDPRTNTLQGKVAVGVALTGPLAARPRDEIGFAVGASGYNPRVTDSQQAQIEAGTRTLPAASREYVAEVYYGYRATPWLTLRPNLQWIHHPGGREDRPDMFVGGLKTVWTF